MNNDDTTCQLVICGGGIIGVALAYYLSELSPENSKSVKVKLVERESVACHSSGKAGGFLALDWNDHSPVCSLSRLSYKLHEDLNKCLSEEDLGYRQLSTFAIEAGGETSQKRKKAAQSYMDVNISKSKPLGTKSTTAQVNPYRLTHALMKAAIANGVEFVKGEVIGMTFDEASSKQLRQVELRGGSHLKADKAVIAMGAWSNVLAPSFPLCPNYPQIQGSKAHSIVLQAELPAEAMFTEFIDEMGNISEPEIYPRDDGTVYVCGEGDEDDPLPKDPLLIQPSTGRCEKLYKTVCKMSTMLDVPILTRQACYLPNSPDGVPIIGQVHPYSQVFIGTGHGCWGILNGPATGKCLAQLILGLSTDIDLSPFSITRFKS